MEILVFKTDIVSKKKVDDLKPMFNQHYGIMNWSVDVDDIDNVLRIETTSNLREEEIIGLVQQQGFYIETLSD